MLGVLDQLSGAHNQAYSICSDEFDGAFSSITEIIDEALPPQCMRACVTDKLGAAGLQPDCSLSYPSEGGSIEIPFCQLDELSRPILADDPLCYYTRAGAAVAGACQARPGTSNSASSPPTACACPTTCSRPASRRLSPSSTARLAEGPRVESGHDTAPRERERA